MASKKSKHTRLTSGTRKENAAAWLEVKAKNNPDDHLLLKVEHLTT
jgi:hypothetical protein